MKHYQGLLRIQLNLAQQHEVGVGTAEGDMHSVQYMLRVGPGFTEDKTIIKPPDAELKAMFNRQIAQIAKEVGADSRQQLKKINLAPNPRERYEACSYYLFMLNTKDFVNALSNNIPVIKPF